MRNIKQVECCHRIWRWHESKGKLPNQVKDDVERWMCTPREIFNGKNAYQLLESDQEDQLISYLNEEMPL